MYCLENEKMNIKDLRIDSVVDMSREKNFEFLPIPQLSDTGSFLLASQNFLINAQTSGGALISLF